MKILSYATEKYKDTFRRFPSRDVTLIWTGCEMALLFDRRRSLSSVRVYARRRRITNSHLNRFPHTSTNLPSYLAAHITPRTYIWKTMTLKCHMNIKFSSSLQKTLFPGTILRVRFKRMKISHLLQECCIFAIMYVKS